MTATSRPSVPACDDLARARHDRAVAAMMADQDRGTRALRGVAAAAAPAATVCATRLFDQRRHAAPRCTPAPAPRATRWAWRGSRRRRASAKQRRQRGSAKRGTPAALASAAAAGAGSTIRASSHIGARVDQLDVPAPDHCPRRPPRCAAASSQRRQQASRLREHLPRPLDGGHRTGQALHRDLQRRSAGRRDGAQDARSRSRPPSPGISRSARAWCSSVAVSRGRSAGASHSCM